MTVSTTRIVAYAFMSCGCEVDLYQEEVELWLNQQMRDVRAFCPKCDRDYKMIVSILPNGFVPLWRK